MENDKHIHNNSLIVTVDTWERDSYGLFDYESNRVNK